MLGRRKKAKETTRRHPTSEGQAGSFSYYRSKRMALPTQANTEVRQPAGTKKQDTATGKPNLKYFTHRLGNILLAFILVACVVSILQIDNNPRIVILNKSSTYSVHTASDYRAAVTDSLRGSLLNSNKVTISTNGVVSDLRQRFPEIYDASVVLPLVGHRPTVYIELARPALVLQSGTQATIIDVTGRALASFSQAKIAGKQELPIVVDQSHVSLKVGVIALSSSNVSFIEDIVRQFEDKGVVIRNMILPGGKEELDVYIQGVPYYVKFNLHETTSREQAGTYFALRQQLARQGKKGTPPKEYVDVRLVGRAYYK